MPFTGGSTSQATQITDVTNRATALETRATNIETVASQQRGDFTAHVASQSTRDAGQDNRLDALDQASIATNLAHNAYVVTNNAKNTEQDGRLTSTEATVSAHYSEFQSTVSNLNTTDSIINTHLSQIDTAISTTNSTAAAFRQTYDAYSASNNAQNVEQDGRLTTVENDVSAFHATYNVDKANIDTNLSEFHGAYDAYTQANDALNTTQNSRLVTVEDKAESTKQAYESYVTSNNLALSTTNSTATAFRQTYDTYVVDNDAKTVEQDDRLDVHESRLDAIDTNIVGRVDSAINSKVATTTFDLLATELRNADSALSTALATKVATTVQVQTDAAQDARINARVLQTAYDTYTASDTNTNKLNEIKIAAMEQFIRALLSTYTVKNGFGQPYIYKGYAQKDFEIAPAALSFVSRFDDKSKINITALEFITRSNANQLRIYDVTQAELLRGSVAAASKTTSTSTGDVTAVYTMTRAVTSADFPIKLRYQDTSGNAICEQYLTYTEYQALPNVDVVQKKITITAFNGDTRTLTYNSTYTKPSDVNWSGPISFSIFGTNDPATPIPLTGQGDWNWLGNVDAIPSGNNLTYTFPSNVGWKQYYRFGVVPVSDLPGTSLSEIFTDMPIV